jgi:hypothetical protein
MDVRPKQSEAAAADAGSVDPVRAATPQPAKEPAPALPGRAPVIDEAEIRAQAGETGDPLRAEFDSALDFLSDGDQPASTESKTNDAGAATNRGFFAGRPPDPASASLFGDGRVISVGDMLGLLSSVSKTGLMWVITARERFLLQLESGAVVFAQSDRPPVGSRLGEILVTRGALEAGQLEQAIVKSRAEGLPLGAWLQQQDMVTAFELRSALALQVQQIFNRMFASPQATYLFEDGRRLASPDDVRLNIVQLLLESARASDEGLRGMNMPVPLGRAAV